MPNTSCSSKCWIGIYYKAQGAKKPVDPLALSLGQQGL